MSDEPHVGLVDAHAESDRGDDDHAVLGEELLLGGAAHLGGQAGMIGERAATLRRQPSGRLVDGLAAEAIDDAGVLGMLGFDELPQSDNNENTLPNSTLSNGARSRWTVETPCIFTLDERATWASLVSGTHAANPQAHASNAEQGHP